MLRITAPCAAALCALATVAFGAGTASAGEVTGNGSYIAGSNAAPLNAKSDCAYSGLNDNYVFGTAGPGNPDSDGFTRTQNWGQINQATRAFLTSIGSSPGVACNPTKATGQG